ncbi:hypothetical protein [Kroppenstedtia eburnea]|uniref:Uncharacterized protein n=1 Tax=Kroppenstedtia eburnea TaxID=714067 RepID=A0A1N7Q866_9BACL|nr:hypothetical protein [Kroppenstedtia eburnea]QKI81114.1 hypothetical protein GXN75_03380 [Kroppenstedtia eburnea]SIT18939.1 hypothetical protein SAMN05421790_12019 [Kroppenstedtia eburnea]
MLDPSIIGATGAGFFMIGFFLLVDKIKGFPKGSYLIKDIPKGSDPIYYLSPLVLLVIGATLMLTGLIFR